MRLIFSIILNASILFAIAYFLSGNWELASGVILPEQQAEQLKTFIIGWIILWLINVTIRPILNILSLPFYLIFFGLVAFIVNGIILKLLTYIMSVLLVIPGVKFEFATTMDFVIAVAIFTILNMVYSLLFSKR
jgi:putative membrane protein